jgi:hypothetical protein
MPFVTHRYTTFPAEFVDVEIHMTGLLQLSQGEPVASGATQCLISVVDPASYDHKLRIQVTDRNDEPIPIPDSVGSTEIKAGLKIFAVNASTEAPTPPKGVTKFLSTAAATFPGAGANRLDFRWGVDLKKFNPDAVPSSYPNNLKLAVTLYDGLLFTSQRTQPAKTEVFLVPPGMPPFDWFRLAATIGANIRLDAGTALALEWPDGVTRRWTLPRGGIDGGCFKIWIDNGPKDSTVHDDLERQYKGIQTNLPHFGLEFVSKEPDPIFASVDAPCMPTVLDGEGRIS